MYAKEPVSDTRQ